MSTATLATALVAAVVGCRPVHIAKAAIPDPHHHVVPVHERPWQTDLAPEARMVAAREAVAGTDSIISPGGTWRAFIRVSPEEPGGRICVETVAGTNREELRGVPLPYRPLSNLHWLTADLLAFDRWSQPHHGVHYVLDVARRRLVLAAPFPDRVTTDTPDRGASAGVGRPVIGVAVASTRPESVAVPKPRLARP